MAKVKARLLKQEVKIKSFEEKKQRTENKKFHKALKDFKMKAKHAEKRDNLDQIKQFKQRIREKGDDNADADFDKIMMKGKGPSTGSRGSKPGRTIDTVRENVRQHQKKKNDFKAGKGKKGGKPSSRGGAKGGSRGGAKGGRGGKRSGKSPRGRKGSKRR